MDVASVFAEPLVDLGTESPAFAGIYAPQSSIGAAKVGVTSQFLENAEQYHRAYFDTGYWNFLLGNALEAHVQEDSLAGVECRKGDPGPPLYRADGRRLQTTGAACLGPHLSRAR